MSIRDMDHDPLTEYPHLLHTLAFYEAVKIVKQELAAKGERVREYSRKEIHALADVYFDDNRSLLMADAIIKVLKEPSLLKLAESESKRRARERVKPMEPAKALKLLEKIRKR
jgi:hypothetical protein